MKTPSQTVGPFYSIGLGHDDRSRLMGRGAPESIELRGRLLDGQGSPISDGLIELWDGKRWGRSGTDSEGGFAFTIAKPPARPGETPRFDVFVFARGLLRHQLTRFYFPDEPNDSDPVFSALDDAQRQTVVATPEEGALRFDIHLQGDRATVFFAH